MSWWQEVRDIIKASRSSSYRLQDGSIRFKSQEFRPLPLSAHENINQIIENECRIQATIANGGRNLDTIADVKARSANLIPAVLNTVKNPASLTTRVADMLGYRDWGGGSYGGGISNGMWMTGVSGQDPAKMSYAHQNLYISPTEAAAIYSQKSLPELIIRKKSHSLLLNGVHISNPFFTPEQIEEIEENMIKTNLAKVMSEALRDGLVYSGSVLFPFFKKDSPLSMSMPVSNLVRYGIVGKDCIDYWCELDRWNTTHFPQWNPTAKDFLKPQYFYIPYLGCDVHTSRISRIVPAPQPGYWGVMQTMGWGVSDMAGWIEAVYNYYNVMQAIPTMINQMSIIARTFNVEGPLATEGAMIMEDISKNETIRVRETSPMNPINLDVIGELKAIERDFSQVPELTRLVRQDLAAKAGLVEELMFSSERGAFASGSDQSASWARQEENIRFMYAETASQFKTIAMLQVINALGLDRKIIKALPYTQMTFDAQKVTDVSDRTDVLAAATKGLFDSVAAGLPIPAAAKMIEQLTGGMVKVSAELYAELEERQKLMDEMEKESHETEMKTAVMAAQKPQVGGGSSSASKSGGGHSYSDPKKQKSKEKVSGGLGGTRKQGLSKSASKKL